MGERESDGEREREGAGVEPSIKFIYLSEIYFSYFSIKYLVSESCICAYFTKRMPGMHKHACWLINKLHSLYVCGGVCGCVFILVFMVCYCCKIDNRVTETQGFRAKKK